MKIGQEHQYISCNKVQKSLRQRYKPPIYSMESKSLGIFVKRLGKYFYNVVKVQFLHIILCFSLKIL